MGEEQADERTRAEETRENMPKQQKKKKKKE